MFKDSSAVLLMICVVLFKIKVQFLPFFANPVLELLLDGGGLWNSMTEL
jgi:hypothetical protein